MRLESISILNCAGFDSKEFALPAVCIVQGKNRQGKSALAACLKYPFDRGHDEDMLTPGADKGEIIIRLDSGGAVRAVIDRATNTTTRSYQKPGERKWIVRRDFVDMVADSLSYDPLKFLRLDEKEQVLELLKVLGPSLTVTTQELVDAVGDAGGYSNFPPALKANMPGLEQVDTYLDERSGSGSLYDQRKDLNVSATALKHHAAEVERALGPAGDVADEALVPDLTARLNVFEKAEREHIADIGKIFQENKDTAINLLIKENDEVDADIDEAIKDLERQRDRRKAENQKTHDQFVEQARAAANMAAGELRAANTPIRADLTAKLAVAQERAQEYQRTEGSRREVESARQEAAKKESEAAVLTQALERLRGLRVKIAEKIPIKGVSIKDGRLLNPKGVPFKKWNQEAQYGFCLRLAVLTHKEAGFVVIDNAETFDSENRAAMLKACKKYVDAEGMQFIVMSVADTELEVKAAE